MLEKRGVPLSGLWLPVGLDARTSVFSLARQNQSTGLDEGGIAAMPFTDPDFRLDEKLKKSYRY